MKTSIDKAMEGCRERINYWQEYTIKFGAGCTQCKAKMFEGIKAWKHEHKKFIVCSEECKNKLDQKRV